MQRFVNNFAAQLTGGLAAAGTVLPISSAAAARLLMGEGDYYLLTLVATLDASQQTTVEVVKATAGAGGAINIERAQEGLSAVEWPAGAWVFCSITAGTLDGLAGAMAEQAELIGQQQAAIEDLQARVAALEAGGAPDGVLIDGNGNYLVDDQGNYLSGV